jgi:hypothetical protein
VAPTEHDQERLENAQLAIRRARLPMWLVICVALVVGGLAYGFVGHLPQAVRLVFAGSAALLAGASVWTHAPRRARVSATDTFFAGFAAERGWRYLPQAPRRLDSPLLTHGDEQRTGRGFRLAVGGHPCLLYEHVRFDGEGDEQHATHYVVLVADGKLDRASGLRIHARQGFRSVVAGRMREVELESTELSQRYVVEVPAFVAESDARALLTPALIAAFLDVADAGAYCGDYLELCVDAVVLASEGTITLEDGDYLDRTVAAVQPLLDRLLPESEAPPT